MQLRLKKYGVFYFIFVQENDYRYPVGYLFQCFGSFTLPDGHSLPLHFSQQP